MLETSLHDLFQLGELGKLKFVSEVHSCELGHQCGKEIGSGLLFSNFSVRANQEAFSISASNGMFECVSAILLLEGDNAHTCFHGTHLSNELLSRASLV